jgi:sugar/nucleoside kinase (ribokinase family)
MAGVLCCGNMVMDVLVRPVERIAWNTTTWVEAIEQHIGGNGANTSYAAAVCGLAARLVSVAGRDPFGDRLLGELAAAGVDVSHVWRSDAPTAATVALVNPAGDRFFLHCVGAGAEAFAEPLELDAALTAGMSRFHLANLFALPGLRRHGAAILCRARAAGLATSVDTGWDSQGRWIEDLAPCLPYTDLLFVNQDEARRVGVASGAGEAAGTGGASSVGDPAGTGEAAGVREAALSLLGGGARTVVVKLGAQGSAVYGAGGDVTVPAFDVTVVDTTGAGDCFAGAFLAALERGLPHPEAARFANAAAALSIRRLGATAGLESWGQTRAWMETAPLRSA